MISSYRKKVLLSKQRQSIQSIDDPKEYEIAIKPNLNKFSKENQKKNKFKSSKMKLVLMKRVSKSIILWMKEKRKEKLVI
jgi:hypothetical protein